MTAQTARSRRLGRVSCGLAIAAVLTSSACAAGQRAQTADQRPTLDGTEASVGNLDLRGLAIAAPTTGASYAPGSSARMRLVIVNNGASADRLTGITSSAITGWGSYASPAAAQAALAPSSATPATTTPATTAPSSTSSGTSSTTPSTTSSAGAGSSSPSTSSSSSTSAAPSSTAAPAPAPLRSVAIGANGTVSWGTPTSTSTLVVSGLRQRLFAAAVVRLTFTFAKAGSVTVPVPVQLTTQPGSSIVPEPANPNASATG